ncbi:Protein of unknown function [Gryllus bimaculatus]|nr:Protein of unknown function [Gryllus bimaculatus]
MSAAGSYGTLYKAQQSYVGAAGRKALVGFVAGALSSGGVEFNIWVLRLEGLKALHEGNAVVSQRPRDRRRPVAAASRPARGRGGGGEAHAPAAAAVGVGARGAPRAQRVACRAATGRPRRKWDTSNARATSGAESPDDLLAGADAARSSSHAQQAVESEKEYSGSSMTGARAEGGGPGGIIPSYPGVPSVPGVPTRTCKDGSVNKALYLD